MYTVNTHSAAVAGVQWTLPVACSQKSAKSMSNAVVSDTAQALTHNSAYSWFPTAHKSSAMFHSIRESSPLFFFSTHELFTGSLQCTSARTPNYNSEQPGLSRLRCRLSSAAYTNSSLKKIRHSVSSTWSSNLLFYPKNLR